jgi:hypothetical protein
VEMPRDHDARTRGSLLMTNERGAILADGIGGQNENPYLADFYRDMKSWAFLGLVGRRGLPLASWGRGARPSGVRRQLGHDARLELGAWGEHAVEACQRITRRRYESAEPRDALHKGHETPLRAPSRVDRAPSRAPARGRLCARTRCSTIHSAHAFAGGRMGSRPQLPLAPGTAGRVEGVGTILVSHFPPGFPAR